ncbi:unnamed protein product, partial [Discosporangium mesarthrocarpum]
DHANEVTLRRTAKTMGIMLTGSLTTCSGCAMGKSIRSRIRFSTTTRAVRSLERIFMELIGNKSTPSLGGNLYKAIVRDDYSRFMSVYPITVKSDACTALERFLAESNTLKANHILLTVRSDDEGRFLRERFSDLCVNLHTSVKNTPLQTPPN